MNFKMELTPFQCDFINPVNIAGKTAKVRRGFYLKIKDSSENFGIGELSPLPGLHREKLTKAIVQLNALIKKINDQEIKLSSLKKERALFNLFPTIESEKIYSSVLFCLEGALLSWLRNAHPKIYFDHFALSFSNISVPVSSLYIPTIKDNTSTTVRFWIKNNISSIKLKIGRLPPEREIKIINDIINYSKETIKIRLDGNRKLTTDDLINLIKNISTPKVIEYVEEPLTDLGQWNSIYQTIKVPLAIDEGLNDYLIKGNELLGLRALIIKPNFHGGLSKAIEIIKFARKNNLKAVISSSFETPVGLKYLGLLSLLQNKITLTPSGIDTSKYLAQTKHLFSPKLKSGHLHFY